MITFRVMSFNVRGAFMDDGLNAWPARRQLNVSTILRQEAHLIGLQEVQGPNWDDYLAMLPDYAREQGPRYNNDEPFCYPAIFWNPELFEPADRGGFWLSKTPDEFSGDWRTACVRSANWVRLVHKASGLTLLHLNTHLDHISRRARLQSARLITRRLAEIRRPDEPVILTGDFNCDANSPTYRHFARSGYVDTFIAAGNVDHAGAFTCHDFQGARNPDYGRVDWILARSGASLVQPANARIVTDAEPPIYPSDHYPVVVDLTIQLA